jgi:pyridoxal phosphate enzyme (YggS family)
MKLNLINLPATIVAVSKNRSKEDIKRLYHQGFTIFGENRIQELLLKVDIDLPITWHMIGHLQSNKVKQAVKYTTLIHSVDSIKLLQAIDKEAYKQAKIMNVLIQINIAKEKTKYGINEDEIFIFVEQAKDLSNIMINGIMVIGPDTDEQAKIKEVFNKAYKLYQSLEKIKQNNLDIKYLSMGMSNDYQIAIESGSNMVRIGRLLFENY